MESSNPSKVSDRLSLLEQWLVRSLGPAHFSMETLQGDASFRRYFRILSGQHRFIVMDAPPAQENCRPFIAIAKGLKKHGLHVPSIIEADELQGFLLLSDFGDTTYLKALCLENADTLYAQALEALATLQSCRHIEGYTIPAFSADWMWREWAWHKEWFLNGLLGLELNEAKIDDCFSQIVHSAMTQPQVFMHRDYHSANLMVTPEGAGLLDFQDAFIGPLTYDLVSLLRDCYIDWPEKNTTRWALDYLALLQARGELQNVSEHQFLCWFDWMGLERHIKALFTFARKYIRDGQSHYLKHIPRTLHYVLTVSERYPELSPLYDYFSVIVQPKLEQTICAQ